MTVTADLLFLPWVQRGGSISLLTTDTLGAAQPGVASATVRVRVNDTRDATMPVSLVGPGQITGLLPGQVIRSDPTRGSRVFEPNYLALIEFDEPSLPWLFTPSAANADGKLRPWLCLLVVRKQEGVRLDGPQSGSLPVLRIDSPARPFEELPDLGDSWAWAHAQLTAASGASPTELADRLSGSPEQSLSRLVCGRVLQPQTDYLACVVPTFELGRLAGLGTPVTADLEQRLDPAWALTPDLLSVELPVLYSWEFATGEGGDFQSLAMLLRARPLPGGVGLRSFDVSHSGVHVAVPDPAMLELGGALRPVETDDPTWPDPDMQQRFRTALAGLVNLSVPSDNPVLAPPRYGAVQGGLEAVDPARRDRWFEGLNLEPAMRYAAQLGTRVIQEQQETLMAAAWEQAAEYRAVSRVVRHAQLGFVVARSVHQRHLVPMDPGVGLQVLAPAQARITRDPAAHVDDTGLVSLLVSTGLTASAYSTSLRRIARPQGAVNRRIQRGAAATGSPPVRRTTAVLRNLQPSVFTARRRIVSTVGLVTIEAVAQSLSRPRSEITWSEGTAQAVQGAPPRPTFALTALVWPRPTRPLPPLPLPILPVVLEGGRAPASPSTPSRKAPVRADLRRGNPNDPDPIDPDPPIDPEPPHDPPRRRDSADARAFRTAASAHLARFYPRNPPSRPSFPVPVDLQTVYTAALVLTEPQRTFTASITALVEVTGAPEQALELPSVTPVFAQPMAAPLIELGQDLVLPGLELVPPNTVVPLETNTPFVEAYLIGLNSEFGRELLWREFPAPPRSTYFTRFWDTSISHGALLDIDGLAAWGDRALGGDRGQPERFVILLRSELLRRYPHAIVYATAPGPPREDTYPSFSGGMEPDVRYFGFDLSLQQMRQRSLVIQEQPSAPRFGIEVDDDPGAGTHLAAPDRHSGLLAQRLQQFPVRITIPATIFLTVQQEEDP